MPSYRIAGIPVWMEPRFAPLLPQSEPYRAEIEKDRCLKVAVSEETRRVAGEKYPNADDALIEYMYTGAIFYTALIDCRGLMLHASAVELDGLAYLFSAPSGTGKSTHTGLWLKAFPGAEILNDDKPAIRLEEDGVFVYGTPWSGKADLSLPHRVKLAGICFLERGKINEIRQVAPDESIPLFLEQTVRPTEKGRMAAMLDLLSDLLMNTKVYKLRCNMDPEAALISHRAMKKGAAQ